MVQLCNPSRPKSPKAAARCRGPLDEWLDPRMFKALSDPTRLRLLACLSMCGRPCSVGEIAECCSVDLSVVSRHLAQLESAGILTATKSGRVVSYQVRFERVTFWLRSLASAFERCAPASPSQPNAACCGKGATCERP